MQRHRSLMELFSDPQWLSDQAGVRERLVDRRDTLVAELIREIGFAVRVPINDIEILKGAYKPQVWEDEDTVKRRAQTAALELLEGRRPLLVLPITPSDHQPPKDT